MYFRLTYVSQASALFDEASLQQLARKAKAKNEAQQVSGALIECDGLFVQTLEGDERVVRSIYNLIARDRRHRRTTIIGEGRYDRRLFTHWAMGCFSVPRNSLPQTLFDFDRLRDPVAGDAIRREIDTLMREFYRLHRRAGGGQCFAELGMIS